MAVIFEIFACSREFFIDSHLESMIDINYIFASYKKDTVDDTNFYKSDDKSATFTTKVTRKILLVNVKKYRLLHNI